MAKVSASCIVPASQSEVFAYLADYRNIPRLQPHFSSARLLSPINQGLGAEVGLEGRFHGMPLRVKNRIIAFDPPHRMVSISEGSVTSRSTWELRPSADGRQDTSVTLTIDYKMKQGRGLLSGLAQSLEHLFHGEIQGMTDDSLRRLHAIFSEKQPSP